MKQESPAYVRTPFFKRLWCGVGTTPRQTPGKAETFLVVGLEGVSSNCGNFVSQPVKNPTLKFPSAVPHQQIKPEGAVGTVS